MVTIIRKTYVHPSRIKNGLGIRARRKSCRSKLVLWVFALLAVATVELQELALIEMVQAEKAYPLGCSHRDPAYYDYENSVFPPVPITIGDGDTITHVPIKTDQDYLLTRRLGAGKFSDVFEAGFRLRVPP